MSRLKEMYDVVSGAGQKLIDAYDYREARKARDAAQNVDYTPGYDSTQQIINDDTSGLTRQWLARPENADATGNTVLPGTKDSWSMGGLQFAAEPTKQERRMAGAQGLADYYAGDPENYAKYQGLVDAMQSSELNRQLLGQKVTEGGYTIDTLKKKKAIEDEALKLDEDFATGGDARRAVIAKIATHLAGDPKSQFGGTLHEAPDGSQHLIVVKATPTTLPDGTISMQSTPTSVNIDSITPQQFAAAKRQYMLSKHTNLDPKLGLEAEKVEQGWGTVAAHQKSADASLITANSAAAERFDKKPLYAAQARYYDKHGNAVETSAQAASERARNSGGASGLAREKWDVTRVDNFVKHIAPQISFVDPVTNKHEVNTDGDALVHGLIDAGYDESFIRNRVSALRAENPTPEAFSAQARKAISNLSKRPAPPAAPAVPAATNTGVQPKPPAPPQPIAETSGLQQPQAQVSMSTPYAERQAAALREVQHRAAVKQQPMYQSLEQKRKAFIKAGKVPQAMDIAQQQERMLKGE